MRVNCSVAKLPQSQKGAGRSTNIAFRQTYTCVGRISPRSTFATNHKLLKISEMGSCKHALAITIKLPESAMFLANKHWAYGARRTNLQVDS